MKSTLSKVNSPVVFAHNDLLLGNILYDEKQESVIFIDYEYTAFNYQAFDIANHFTEYAGNYMFFNTSKVYTRLENIYTCIHTYIPYVPLYIDLATKYIK